VDSVLVADVPLFEAEPFAASARSYGIEPVMIAAANTPASRLAEIAKLGGGYTYCVARAGVTGADQDVHFEHEAMLTALKEAGAPPPIFGFGISKPDHVRAALKAGASGVISGSAIVARIAAGEPVEPFIREMKSATL
jgi:tryptophan synthase alpha chain